MSNRTGRGQTVNRTQMAELIGVAMPTLDHWVRIGCPVMQRGSKGVAWQFNTADVIAWREEKARADAVGGQTSDVEELKRRRLQAQTEQAELELAKARGEVAPVRQFERAIEVAFAEVRANLRTISSRVPRMIVGETDEARIKRVLTEEIDQALVALSEISLADEGDLDIGEDVDDDGAD